MKKYQVIILAIIAEIYIAAYFTAHRQPEWFAMTTVGIMFLAIVVSVLLLINELIRY